MTRTMSALIGRGYTRRRRLGGQSIGKAVGFISSFLLLFKAKDGLPFGAANLYDADDPKAVGEVVTGPDGKDLADFGRQTLSLCYGKDRESRPNLGDTGESLCVQFLALCVFPTAEYVCSNFHAGQTQVSFGSNFRRKADCLISVEEDEVEMEVQDGQEVEVSPGHWRRLYGSVAKRPNKRRFLQVVNFHGTIYHGSGKHLPSCRKYVPPEEGGEEEEDELGRYDDGDQFGSKCEERQRQKKRYKLSKGIPEHWLRGEARRRHEVLHPFPSPLHPASDQGRGERGDQDLLKQEYAAALTGVDPDLLVIQYLTLHECCLLHQTCPPDPARWNLRTCGGVRRDPRCDAWNKYKTVREYLKCEFPQESLLGTRRKSFTQASLVEHIKSTGYNSTGGDFSGFVVVSGGRETRTGDGVVPNSWGFCHQRSGLDADRQVGNFTKFQAKMQHRGEREVAAGVLKKLAAKDGTLVRTSFDDDSTEVLGMDYFRFLLDERSFAGFRIRHCIWYRHKPWLNDFIVHLLQMRHELKKNPAYRLFCILLKLILNGKHNEHAALLCLSLHVFFLLFMSLRFLRLRGMQLLKNSRSQRVLPEHLQKTSGKSSKEQRVEGRQRV